MSYTLISSERSPFGRICRMLMIKHNIPHEFRILNFVDSPEDAKALAKESPINKVPILVDGEQKIFDSRVIAHYLQKKHNLPELSVDEENIISALYSVMDVSVILFLMKMNGYDMSAKDTYLRRQKERIPSNLEYVKSWTEKLNPHRAEDWNMASMSLYSCLYWSHLRAGTLKLDQYPHFQKFLEQFSGFPGVKETSFN